MKDPIRKIVVDKKKAPKSVLVVTNTMRMRPRIDEIRALGYECALVEAGGGERTFLQGLGRVNVVVVDMVTEVSAEKLIRWITEIRPGVRMVCILNTGSGFGSKAAALGAAVLDESEIATIPEVLRNLLSQQASS